MLPSIFTTSLHYTPKSERDSTSPATFKIKTFPYHFLSLFQLTNDIKKIDGVFSDSVERALLEHCIEDFSNVTDKDGNRPSISEVIDILPFDIVQDLLDFIFEIGMYNNEWLNILDSSLHSILNPRFSDESWDCNTCQRRRMDRSRNCPFLPVEDHDIHISYPVYGGVVKVCPIGTADPSVTSKAVEAYRYRKQALLPEEGGIRNQTVFFMIASQRVEEIKNYYESQEEK